MSAKRVQRNCTKTLLEYVYKLTNRVLLLRDTFSWEESCASELVALQCHASFALRRGVVVEGEALSLFE